MLNLLSNAIKFTPAGGRIIVSAAGSDGKVCISVKDTGIGIPAEKQKVIFERFIQVNSSLSKEQEGSGIGLWLVKAFVGLHGGNIRISSEPGKGSEFIVELPLKLIENSCPDQPLQGFRQDSLLQAADMEFTTFTNM
jgi:signal transduction histidine kinase